MLMASNLKRVIEAAANMSDEDFAAVYGETAFILEAMDQDGGVIELCSDGSSKCLTRANAGEYISLFLQAYTKLDELQFRMMYEAFEDVATKNVLALVSPQIVKRRISSNAIIDVESMKASTEISHSNIGSDEDEKKAVDMFW